MIRLVAYLLGVGAMGSIAQGTVGSGLHDVVWTTKTRTIPGEVRIVTETTTAPGRPTPPSGAPREIAPAPLTTILVTVPGRPRTTTVTSPGVTTATTVDAQTVSSPGPAVTTTVRGPTVTTTVPGPTRTTTVDGPTTTVDGPTTTVSAPAVTTTVPGPTETVTVTVTVPCDPPPKPSNPPCPPHK